MGADSDDVTASGESARWRPGSVTIGTGLCLLFAFGVAACGLSFGDDNEAAPATDAPVADTQPDSTAVATTEATAAEATAETTTPETSAPQPATTAPDPFAVSFASSIEPIITETCAKCHTGNGPGTQHVRFDTADDVSRTSFAIALVTKTKFMPPWPASEGSVDFQHDWSLTDEEIAAIIDWDDDGGLLDVDPDKPMIPESGVVGIQNPDVKVESIGSYDGEFGQPDEYRCFIYDPEVTETSFAAQLEFIPQQTQVVHHAVGFLMSAEDRPGLEERNGADGQGGWTCFGFSPAPSADLVFTWAPGTDPASYPEGTGLRFDPGDFFVMQTHYHYDVEADADQSSFAIEWAEGDDIEQVNLGTYLAPAEIPCAANESGPLCDRQTARDRAVAAYGEQGVLADLLVGVCGNTLEDFTELTNGTQASASCEWGVQNPGVIVSVFGHEHEIGKSFRLTINPDTPDEIVLLDIETWDFDWQFIYEPVDEIVLDPGDRIRVECVWDRDLRDPLLEPAYVLWADGTDDEMCFSTIVTRPV